ncbi:MAG: WYL domain-containing protein [Acidimicrobiales bacterium]|nr:WYL domain-containing protein [Acidimicrobiales bacterium]
MEKLERLLDLITVLMEADRPLTRHEVRSTLPAGAYSEDDIAFRRTFERDKDELRSLGIQLVVTASLGEDPPIDGYWIDRGAFGVDQPVLDPDESSSLALATAVVRIDPDRPGRPIWKLSSLDEDLPSEGRSLPTAEVPGGEAVRFLMGAVTGRRAVTFCYRGEERAVEPHRLVYAKGRWQLSGYDRIRNGARQYRVDRIEGTVADTGDSFTAPVETRQVEVDHPWKFGSGADVEVRVRVDRRHVPWLETFLGESSKLEKQRDGAAELVEQVRDLEAYRSFLLTFLDGVVVLEPPAFRDDMKKWLNAMVEGDELKL